MIENFVSFIRGLDDDTLLSGKSTLEDDNDSSVFNAMKVKKRKKERVYNFPIAQSYSLLNYF